MDPWRPVPRSFYNYWGDGQGYLDIFVHTVPGVLEPHGVETAHVVLYQQNRAYIVGSPTFLDNEGILTPPIHESWHEDLQAFGFFEQTVAGQAIAAHIRSVPYLRDFVKDYFINAIASEAREAALTAASLHHRTLWMIVDLNITIHFGYNGGGDEDDDDFGSYEDETVAEGEDDADVQPLSAPEGVGVDVQPLSAPEEMGADAEAQPLSMPEEMGADAEAQPLPMPEGVDGEVQQLQAPERVDGDGEVQQLQAPEGVVEVLEVEPAAPEELVGNVVVVEARIGDMMLEGVVEDPPGDPEEYVDLEILLTNLLGQPVAPILEAVGTTRGLTPAAIAYHLTVDNFSSTTPETCSICLENIANGTSAGWLPCSHIFHPLCISKWLDRSAVCPICRFKLSNNIHIDD